MLLCSHKMENLVAKSSSLIPFLYCHQVQITCTFPTKNSETLNPVEAAMIRQQ